MRRHLGLLLLLILLPAPVRAEGVCQEVSKHSWGFIRCEAKERVVALVYSSVWVWKKVQSSGKHADLLSRACSEADYVREIILADRGNLEYNTQCTLIASR